MKIDLPLVEILRLLIPMARFKKDATKREWRTDLNRSQNPRSSLRVVVSLACLVGLLLSRNLWLSDRLYPLTPLASWIPKCPSWMTHTLYILALVVLAGIAIFKKYSRHLSWVFGGIALLWCIWDASRLQPWFYQYTLMLVSLAAVPKLTKKGLDGLVLCRWIVTAIYFWSGFHKLNDQFITDVFPWMISPFTSNASLAYLVPWIEMGIAIGLWHARTRRASVVAGIGMHAFILASLGPFGHDWNTIVWPWNVAMALSLWVLFWKAETPKFWETCRGLISTPSYAHGVFLLMFCLPPLNLVGWWGSYLSFSLYSGNTKQPLIRMSERTARKLNPSLQKYLRIGSEDKVQLSLMTWSIEELGVPPYPETTVFKSLGHSICKETGNPRDIVLTVQHRSHWLWRNEKTETYSCNDLAE